MYIQSALKNGQNKESYKVYDKQKGPHVGTKETKCLPVSVRPGKS